MVVDSQSKIEEGSIIDNLEVLSLGERGDGIAKFNGFVIIIPNGVVGDVLSVKINRVLPKYAFGEII